MRRASSTPLPDDVLVPVAHDMKSDILALVLANMNADNAKALTVKLAGRLTLPETPTPWRPRPPPPCLRPYPVPRPRRRRPPRRPPATPEKAAAPKG